MTTEQAFWSLLRAGLWEQAPQGFDVPLSEAQWDALLQMAQEQTLQGVLYDGMCLLPEEMQPPQAFRLKWFWNVNKIEQTNRLINRVLVEFVEKLEAEGIRPLLLKGQSNAVLYPKPLHRQCGDIDLFIGRKDYPKACALVREWGMSDDEEEETLKHLHSTWQGVLIELHRVAAIFPWPSTQRHFLRWSEDELLHSVHTFVPSTEKMSVAIPSVEFNVVFVFYHMFQHFLDSGVGLRQLCDCVRWIYVYQEQLDKDQLKEWLQKLGLMHSWQVFGNLFVYRMGLPKAAFPFFQLQEEKAEKVIKIIEQEGNFGLNFEKKKNNKGSFVWVKFKRFLYNTARFAKVMRIFPKDTLLAYCYYIVGRGRLFIGLYIKR